MIKWNTGGILMPRSSPFPGMDPYLEQHWGDVRASLVVYAADQLQPLLPEGLRARMNARFILAPGVEPFCTSKGGEVVPNERMRQSYIEIRDGKAGYKVITAIEVLCRANKLPGEGRDFYVKDQQARMGDRVNLVEIDLLRDGQEVCSIPLQCIPLAQTSPYKVCVRRGGKPEFGELYPISLRSSLPRIAIPLREEDADVPLNLQALIEQSYRNGGYEDTDYRKEPESPLDAADQQWADELLRGKSLR